MGAALYGRSSSALFLQEPLVACAAGFRLANPAKRLWDGAPTVETEAGDGWQRVEVAAVDALAGTLTLAAAAAGRLRAEGRHFPLQLVATAEAWTLEAAIAVPGRTLAGGGGSGRFAGATVALDQPVLIDPDGLAGLLFVLLDSGRGELCCLASVTAADSRQLRLHAPPGQVGAA